MKLTIENTARFVVLDVPPGKEQRARLWQGVTEGGVPVTLVVAAVSCDLPDTPENKAVLDIFEAELVRVHEPSERVSAFDLRFFVD